VYWRSRKRASSKQIGLEVRQLGAAGAAPGRVAALRHEAGDHAVEHDAVVEAFLRQLADPLDVTRREIGAEADHHVAAAVEAEHEGVEFVGHVGISCWGWRRLRR
jgi:hypothetical protein